ncbi:MAG: hypothetical protein DMF87_17775 [Acidobacteria bacterium]|nr:MAG: hypothetical protein DMF87_17775 [Acidobacteriota bacterium]
MLPEVSNTTQYLGNQANGVNPNGRFVSMDGVNMYREWGQAHQEFSPDTLTHSALTAARATEAVARARMEIAQRGLVVTATRTYYALVIAQRKYAAAQDAAQQALRFLQITQQAQQLGQVARADVIKAEIQYRQEEQAFREATLAMDNARLGLAVIVFPDLNENFTVVDDLTGVPTLPPFMDVQALAGKENPDLRAATEALRAASADIRTAQYAFYPRLVVDAVYGIEANQFALHGRIAAQPEMGVLPNLGYFVTASLNVPIWDWGSRRAKLIQADVKRKQAQVTLSFTQRQLASNLYVKYNEAIAARGAATDLQQVARSRCAVALSRGTRGSADDDRTFLNGRTSHELANRSPSTAPGASAKPARGDSRGGRVARRLPQGRPGGAGAGRDRRRRARDAREDRGHGSRRRRPLRAPAGGDHSENHRAGRAAPRRARHARSRRTAAARARKQGPRRRRAQRPGDV